MFIPYHLRKGLRTGDVPPGAPPATPPTGTDPVKPPAAGDAKFTQADVDRIIGERLTRAEETATAKLLETLGVKTPEELRGKLTKAQELEEAQMTALQKAEKAATDAQAERDQIKADAEKRTAESNQRLMKAAVISQAANFHDPNDAWLYVDKEKLTIDEKTGDVKGAKEAVEAVAKAKAHLIKAPGGKGTPLPNGNGNGNSGIEKKVPAMKVRL